MGLQFHIAHSLPTSNDIHHISFLILLEKCTALPNLVHLTFGTNGLARSQKRWFQQIKCILLCILQCILLSYIDISHVSREICKVFTQFVWSLVGFIIGYLTLSAVKKTCGDSFNEHSQKKPL